jgi:hypothetical protein
MPQFLVTTKRADRGSAPTARQAVAEQPGVTVVAGDDPNMVTIDADEDAAARLREKLQATHYVEPLVRRSLH